MNQSFLKQALPHIVAILSFVLVSIVYFYPQLSGESIRSSDTALFNGMAKESLDHKKKTGEATLWTNSMFGGMPTYQISSPYSNNVFRKIQYGLYMGFGRPIGYFIFGSISCYLMLLMFGVNPWLSISMSIGFSFMTNHVVLFEAGHMSKILAIMSSPLIIGGLWSMFRRRLSIGFIAFALGLGLNISANHIQMTYYLAIILVVYFLMEAIQLIKKGQVPLLGKIVAICTVSCLIGLGASASKMLPTYEYSKDTMRGKPILTQTGAPTSSSETDGLEFGYAMAWSNGYLDLFSSIIPRVVGGGAGEKISSDSAFAKGVRNLGSRTETGPMYWGPLPFTVGPIYFGMIFFFLMTFGFFAVKGPIKWWIFFALILTLLLSLGKNFSVLNKTLFDYLPLFNKFRTPNSVLSVTAVFIPVLGGLVLQALMVSKNKDTFIRPLLISTGILSLICGFFAVIGPGFFDFIGAEDGNYANVGLDKALVEDRKSMMRMDSLRSLGLMAVAAIGIYLFVKNKISTAILIGLISILVLFDQLGVARRYLDTDSFQSSPNANLNFTPRTVDSQILTDTDPHYRVYDQSINTFNSSMSSYFHKTIGGAHAAKLQRIEDLRERQILKGNQKVLDMLNTKYFIIQGQNDQPEVRRNPGAAGNAWLASSIQMVASADEEINALNSFDPTDVAIVHQEFSNYLSGLQPVKNGSITLSEYAPNELSYDSQTTSEQFAVFSEMWYGPDKGWQAYVDGKPVDHIRVNYALRGMKIPAGNHRITFIFDPQIYKTGSLISLISSILFLLGVFAFGWFWYRGREERAEDSNLKATSNETASLSSTRQDQQSKTKATTSPDAKPGKKVKKVAKPIKKKNKKKKN